jgi:hypothetical protein
VGKEEGREEVVSRGEEKEEGKKINKTAFIQSLHLHQKNKD